MSILAHLCHQDTRTPPFAFRERIRQGTDGADFIFHGKLPGIHAANRANDRGVTTPDVFHGQRNLAKARPGSRGFDCQHKKISPTRFCTPRNSLQRCLYPFFIPTGTELRQSGNLRFAYSTVVNFENCDRVFFRQAVPVDTNDRFTAGVDMGLPPGRRLFDTHLGQTGLDGFGHPAQTFDLMNVLPGAPHQQIRQSLDEV